MKNIFSKYWVWLLLVVMVFSEFLSYIYLYPYSGTDYIFILFGTIGVIALLYLTLVTEKKQKNNRKSIR